MSSYLNIYGVPKEGGPLRIMCFSRSSNIYSSISSNMSIAFVDTTITYTDLNEEYILDILNDINENIQKLEKLKLTYEKYASINTNLIMDIIDSEVDIEELVRTKHYLEMIKTLIYDAKNGFNGFNKICCNID